MPAQRAIYRLIALIEVFDAQVAEAHSSMLHQPNHSEYAMLNHLTRHFLAMTVRNGSPELSIETLEALRPAYGNADVVAFRDLIDRFVRDRGQKLQNLLDNYPAEAVRNPRNAASGVVNRDRNNPRDVRIGLRPHRNGRMRYEAHVRIHRVPSPGWPRPDHGRPPAVRGRGGPGGRGGSPRDVPDRGVTAATVAHLP